MDNFIKNPIMKKNLQIAAFLMLVCLLFTGSRVNVHDHCIGINDDPIIVFPDEVKNIIDNKCYGCHNPESRSVMAKGKLMWDDLTEMKKSALVKKLDKISEVLEDGSMPPSKFLKQNPDARLSEEEIRLLKGWADKTARGLEK